jgi:hypothetical protein
MKILVTILFMLFCFASQAQQKIVKYIDSSWNYTTKEYAKYYVEIQKQEPTYLCTAYYVSSHKFFSKAVFFDTLFQRGKGKLITYYESGKIKDSTLFSYQGKVIYNYGLNENGTLKDSTRQNFKGEITDYYLFHDNGKLYVHNIYNSEGEVKKTEAFNENGKLIPNFIYLKQAEFPGGIDAWRKYLEHNLKANLPARKKAPVGKYSVIILFTVDKDGNVSNVIAENDPGYGTKEEAIRVIAKGPKWIPAIQYNKPVIFKQKQTITFLVSNE